MTSPVVISKAQRTDAQTVRAIRDAAILFGCSSRYQASLLREWIAGPIEEGFIKDVEASFYIAGVGDRIVATGKIDLKRGHIDAIFVSPDYMRSGIGRAMMEHLEKLAIDAGILRLTLDSTLNAAPFYRCCGFVGETISKYTSPRGLSLDCIPMSKNLVLLSQMPNKAVLDAPTAP